MVTVVKHNGHQLLDTDGIDSKRFSALLAPVLIACFAPRTQNKRTKSVLWKAVVVDLNKL
jgi:hypothetical protein